VALNGFRLVPLGVPSLGHDGAERLGDRFPPSLEIRHDPVAEKSVAGSHFSRLCNGFLILDRALTSGSGNRGTRVRTMQRIEIDEDFTVSVERLYAYLSEHENLSALFGAKVARMRDGDTDRNGAGSVRQLRVGLLPPFEETVDEAVVNQRIDYHISKGSPLRNHRGTMRFTSTPTGSHLNYVIEFGAVVPGLDRIVKPVLEANIRKGLAAVDRLA
jgi:hypothetical protein